jgi:hypothetical protein
MEIQCKTKISRTPVFRLAIDSFQKLNDPFAFHGFLRVGYGASRLAYFVKDDSFFFVKDDRVHSASGRPVNVDAANVFFWVVENAVASSVPKLNVAFPVDSCEEGFAESTFH